jgi:hypothetical protein
MTGATFQGFSSFDDHEDVTHMQLVLQFWGIIQPVFYLLQIFFPYYF